MTGLRQNLDDREKFSRASTVKQCWPSLTQRLDKMHTQDFYLASTFTKKNKNKKYIWNPVESP